MVARIRAEEKIELCLENINDLVVLNILFMHIYYKRLR